MSDNKPPFVAYAVEDFTKKDGTKDSNWTRIGVLFPHKDGKGFDLNLRALPIGGRVVIRANEPKAEGQGDE